MKNSSFVNALVCGIGTGIVSNFISNKFPNIFSSADDKILQKHKDEFLKYYYDVLIQGVPA